VSDLSNTLPEIKPKILYIDDDPFNRSLVNRLLTNYNFQVIEAETGLEGLQVARRELPTLILMDINMPGLDGHETTTRMRSISGLEQTPIIAITASTTKGERELALTAGCDGYITKPIDIDEFPHQIIAYLEGQKDTISKDERHYYLGKYSQKLVARLESKILELEEANARLQKIDKIKSDFVTVAAHELRTPITLVYGYSRLLQSVVKDSDRSDFAEGNVVDLTDRIFHAIHRLSEVVNDILNISLIESNEMRLDYTSVNLGEIINDALQELDPAKNERILNITQEDLDKLPNLFGDRKRLQQVFWNILSNATKFTPNQGSIYIKGWVATPATTVPSGALPFSFSDQSLIVMIQDTGIGIAPTEQKAIFERFYMVGDPAYHSSSKTAFGGGGIGLGLPIARGIIEAHGGRIWVESKGRDIKTHPGSTFYILLPITAPKR
jgi:signal transduction histidine kinase